MHCDRTPSSFQLPSRAHRTHGLSHRYELFSLIDGGTEGVTVEDDNRISKAEWVAALPLMQAAAKSWAPFEALKTATADSFSQVDANGGGYIVLTEMCEWIENGEKTAGTEMGKVLGVGE